MNIKPWLEKQIIRRPRSMTDDGETLEYDEEPLPQLQEQALEFILYENHRYPEYEIWFYDDIAMKMNSLFHLFLAPTSTMISLRC